MKTVKAALDKFYPFLAVGVFFLLWFIAAKIIGLDIILPTPGRAAAELAALAGEKIFWLAVLNTLGRSLISFTYSFIFALVLSIISYLIIPVYKLLSPIVVIFRSTPTMSIILLSIIWLTSDTSPVLIAFLIIFPLLYAGFYGGLNQIDKDLIKMSKIYRVPLYIRLKELYIPGIAAPMFTSVKSAISLNVKIVIASEVIAQTKDSMGNLMQISRSYLNTAELLAWTIAAVLISYLLELLVVGVKKLVVRWER